MLTALRVEGIFLPLAGQIGRPVRENVTPKTLRKIVFCGGNLHSYQAASDVLEELISVSVSPKTVKRITDQISRQRVDERNRQVESFRQKPLAEKVISAPDSPAVRVGVVMMDGGRFQRRDHFLSSEAAATHWRESKVGVLLSMLSEVHDTDPHPQFPVWLAESQAVRQLASLGELEVLDETSADAEPRLESDSCAWEKSASIASRQVIASSVCAETFGFQLEQAAWKAGLVDAERTAFVADGASCHWAIHRRHFSRMTPILDLMHALSYAYRAARDLERPEHYARWARGFGKERCPL